jgi:GH24 family phage-related lysozyme (muramidase)
MSKTTSKAGIDLIKRFEGLRLVAYLDAVGVPTIGYGHTRSVHMGQRVSEAEADAMLKDDLTRFEHAVNDYVSVEINQHEFDALVSFAFNVGADALRRSTLLRLLNEGKRQGAAEQFLRWDKAGGRRLDGLKARRTEERDLFLRPMYVSEHFDRAQPWDPDGLAIDLPTLRSPFPLSAGTEVLRRLLPPSRDLDDAVKRFQSGAGLTPDGVVGPVTWGALLAKKPIA